MQRKKISPQQSILVAIRVRPLNAKQQLAGQFQVVRVQDQLIVKNQLVLDPVQIEFQAEHRKMLDVYHRSKQQRYTFDRVFKDHSQQEIFQQTCKPLIRTALSGCNATVFVYGPTGAGKTYTMLGSQQVLGLSVLTVQEMFQTIGKDYQNNYDIIITYVQIYNQTIRDLLIPSSSYLQLRDDPQKGIVIAGVTQFRAQSTQQVMNLLLTGNKRRTTQATNANLTSSRSHAVFQISINKRPKARGPQFETLLGKLSLIDLAGSQRGTVTQNRGIRLMQGAKINRSLLALANCINALGDKSKKGYFVPYRDSKLTRLLKDSLGGNCKTVMIANVSPASNQFQQTINTLKYANRAKNIKTKQIPNKKMVHLHISQYKNIINDLRSQIQSLKLRLHQKAAPQLQQDILIRHPPTSAKKGQVCSCGRNQDLEQMKKIQQQIFQNFQDRIQLRRALMQVQQQNALNALQIKRKTTQINLWKKSHPTEDLNEQVRNIMKNVLLLKSNTQKNILKKQYMNLQLMQNITNTKNIRDQIPKRIKFKDKRNFLQLLIKNHILQLQNIQLEINISIQEKSMIDLKNIISSQRRILIQNGLDSFQQQPILPDQDLDQFNFQTQDLQMHSDDQEQFQQSYVQKRDFIFQKPPTRVWARQKSGKSKKKQIIGQDSQQDQKRHKKEKQHKNKVGQFSINGQQLFKPVKKQLPKKDDRQKQRQKQRYGKDRQQFSDFNLKGIGVGKRQRSKKK